MTTFDQQRAEEYLKRPLSDLLDELSLYDDTYRGIGDSISPKIIDPVRQRICTDWNWCEVRQDSRFENDYDLLAAILAKLTVTALDIPFDVDYFLIAAILVKRGVDNFCGCP